MKVDTLSYLFHYIVIIGGLLAIIALLISYGFPDVFLPSADNPSGTTILIPSSPLPTPALNPAWKHPHVRVAN